MIRAYNKFVRSTAPRRIDLPAVYGGLMASRYASIDAFTADVLAVLDDLPAHLSAFSRGAVVDDVRRVCKHLRTYFDDLISEAPVGDGGPPLALRDQREKAIDEDPTYVSKKYINLKSIHGRLTKRRATLEVNVFMRPVDTELYPDYLSRIETPMDLGTVESRLPTYRTLGEFTKDVRLVFSNCLSYNADIPANKKIRSWAESMRATFERIMSAAVIDAVEKRNRRALGELVRSECFYVACGGEEGAFGSNDHGGHSDDDQDGDYEEEEEGEDDEHVRELKRFMLQEKMAAQRREIEKTNQKVLKKKEREVAVETYKSVRKRAKEMAVERARQRLLDAPQAARGEKRKIAPPSSSSSSSLHSSAPFKSFKLPKRQQKEKKDEAPQRFLA